jgi:hypothetical protein
MSIERRVVICGLLDAACLEINLIWRATRLLTTSRHSQSPPPIINRARCLFPVWPHVDPDATALPMKARSHSALLRRPFVAREGLREQY